MLHQVVLVQAGNAHMSERGLCLTQVCSPDAPALLQQCPNAVGASVVWDRSCLSPGEKTRPDGGGGVSQFLYTTNPGPPRTTADTSIHGCFFIHSKFSSIVVPEHKETSSYILSLSSTFQLSFSPLLLVSPILPLWNPSRTLFTLDSSHFPTQNFILEPFLIFPRLWFPVPHTRRL